MLLLSLKKRKKKNPIIKAEKKKKWQAKGRKKKKSRCKNNLPSQRRRSSKFTLVNDLITVPGMAVILFMGLVTPSVGHFSLLCVCAAWGSVDLFKKL